MNPFDIVLTPKQQSILSAIDRRVEGSDCWVAVAVLEPKKTCTKMTAIARNLRELERGGYIERRIDHRSC